MSRCLSCRSIFYFSMSFFWFLGALCTSSVFVSSCRTLGKGRVSEESVSAFMLRRFPCRDLRDSGAKEHRVILHPVRGSVGRQRRIISASRFCDVLLDCVTNV